MKLFATTVYPATQTADCRVELYDNQHGPLTGHYDLLAAHTELLHRYASSFFVGETPEGMQLGLTILVDLGQPDEICTPDLVKRFLNQFLLGQPGNQVYRIDLWDKDLIAWLTTPAPVKVKEETAADDITELPGQPNIEG